MLPPPDSSQPRGSSLRARGSPQLPQFLWQHRVWVQGSKGCGGHRRWRLESRSGATEKSLQPRVQLQKETLAGAKESLGVNKVPMWPLWTILLLMQLWGSLGAPLCRREPFYFLVAIMKMLGNKNDGTLYTSDDLSARGPHLEPQAPRGRGEKEEENKVTSEVSVLLGQGLDKLPPTCPHACLFSDTPSSLLFQERTKQCTGVL
ncbi:uncharacterized protein LOC123624341 isoform X2 [Lemur catta]|uniref:uncharacterized protein LOC123624341 isoform X2 n=1 Tax=Lemur catta TaxID=9447 RepID=UPI001E268D01|nr:uncharacterized protein LOC123624341 isoform X2 [Lemur catta]